MPKHYGNKNGDNGNGNENGKSKGGMSWIQALKSWNKKHGGKYVIPKKGTKEYNEVKDMMKK